MGRTTGLLALALLHASAAGTWAASPAPTCRLPSVVAVVAQDLRLDPRYARIDPRSITEAPGAEPRIVRCSVCVEVLYYDMPRFGEAQVVRCEPHSFAVRAVRGGYVVQLAR
jgi:hypothetical protein